MRAVSAIPTAELRPLALGELIDRAVRFWRANWRALFGLYLPFQLALYSLLKLYVLSVLRWFPSALGGARAVERTRTDPVAVLGELGRAGALAVPTVTLYWLVASLAAVCASRYVGGRYLGEPVTLGQSLSRMRQRTGALLGASLWMAVWGALATLAASLPGGALTAGGAAAAASGSVLGIPLFIIGIACVLFGWLVALVLWVLRFLLLPEVLALEEGGAWAAVRRSGALISGRVGPGLMGRVGVRATVLLTAAVTLLWAAQFLTTLPQLILQFIYANPLDPANGGLSAIPQALLVPAELLQVATQALFTPLYATICVVFYLDLRVRREGLDLERRLAALPPKVAA